MSFDREGKGEQYARDAEATLKKFSLFKSKDAKAEEAIELYEKAVGQFKLAKQWEEAARAYLRMSELCSQLKEDSSALRHLTSAAQCFQNVKPKEAIRVFRQAVVQHMNKGQFSAAARDWKEIAKLEEKEGTKTGALDAWEQAARCHEAENSKAAKQQALVQVARLAAEADDLKKAVQIWEDLARDAVDNDLLRWSATEYLYKAGLATFALESRSGESKLTEAKLDEYKDVFPAFENTRECKFLEVAAAAFKEDSLERFQDAVAKFDSIKRLDNWQSKMLLRVKEVLKEGVPAGGDGAPGGPGGAADVGELDDPLAGLE